MLQEMIIFIDYSEKKGHSRSRSKVTHAEDLANSGPSRHLEAERITGVCKRSAAHPCIPAWGMEYSNLQDKIQILRISICLPFRDNS